MFIFVIISILLCLYKIKFHHNESVLTKTDTLMINGIFTLLIFLSHCTQYFELNSSLMDALYGKFQTYHGQLVVTTFLAFSGYGVMYQLSNNPNYLKSFVKNRVIKTLINFDIAVMLYYITGCILNKNYKLSTVLLSLIGYKSIGNSNWYIFTILIMYILSYICAKVLKKDNLVAIGITLGTFIYIVISKNTLELPTRFYSTVLCYPFGVYLCLYKDIIIKFIKKYFVIVAVLCLFFLIYTYRIRKDIYIMNIHSIVFVLMIVVMLTQVKIGNKAIGFLGTHAFSIYILQRIPMIFISMYLGTMNKYILIVLSFILTAIMAVIFDKLCDKLHKQINLITR